MRMRIRMEFKAKILRRWSIMFGLVELEFRLDGEGGRGL